jgi:hypothetical protein
METKNKPKTKAASAKSKTDDAKQTEERPKSTMTLFREKYPEGIGYIVDMRAVLK